MQDNSFTLGQVARFLGKKPHLVTYALTGGHVPEPELRMGNKRVFHKDDLRRLADYFGIPMPQVGSGEPDEGELDDPTHRPEGLSLAGPFTVEVYPDPGKPFRRPFGRDYKTITPDGILTDWRDQLAYFVDDDRRIPDLPTVVRAFIEIVDAEVAMARKAVTTFGKDGQPGRIDFMSIAERLTVIEGWLNAGCPEWQGPQGEETGEQPQEEGHPSSRGTAGSTPGPGAGGSW